MQKAKRALIIHENNDMNCGDQITFLGTKSLLTKALGGPEYLDIVQFDFNRAKAEEDNYIREFNWGRIDIVALAGSPWLWHKCGESQKYKFIFDAVERYPKAKKIALGLGSCHSLDMFNRTKENEVSWIFDDDKKCAKTIGVFDDFDYILVRDSFAQIIFYHMGISDIKYCTDTSAYAYNFLGRNMSHKSTGKKALWFYDPTKGLSRGSLPADPREYIDYQLQWAKDNDADIYYNHVDEGIILRERNIAASFSVDLHYLFGRLACYDEILSGRIHMAILGFLAGVPDITVLPVDSRYLTTLKFGIKHHFIGPDWEHESESIPDNVWKNILQEEKQIVSELNTILNS